MSDHVHVSDLRFDRLIAGELDDTAAASVRADASACVVCSTRLAHLTRESELFARRPPLVAPSRRRMWWIAAPVVIAAAAAVMVFVRTDAPSGERTKGPDEPSLIVLTGAPEQRPHVLSSGDRVRAGDYVQVAYSAKRDGFGAVLSRDGAGTTSVYVPADGSVMVPLPAGISAAYPSSTILDDTLGVENLVVLWCDRPLGLQALVAELAANGDVAAPQGCTARRVTFTKEAR